MTFKSIEWVNNKIKIIDQRLLPEKVEYIFCTNIQELNDAIKSLAVRGAPALGIAAAMGIALAAHKSCAQSVDDFLMEIDINAALIRETRPTAVNLFWGIERQLKLLKKTNCEIPEIKRLLIEEAVKIAHEDEMMCKSIGDYGSSLVKTGSNILTHCNAGGLATGGYGTAVGVIRSAHRQGKKIHVFVDETRPLLQGSRLTAWELKEEGVPYTIITDNSAGFLMKRGMIDLVVVGADRITRNGDTANKIGTYSVSVLAKENNIPFYVAAPYSTIDSKIETGEDIKIEERDPLEVTMLKGVNIAPDGSMALNLAFDVTPSRYITAIITEKGVHSPPYDKNFYETKIFSQGGIK